MSPRRDAGAHDARAAASPRRRSWCSAARAASARRRSRPRPRSAPRPASAARCSCSPSTRPAGSPTALGLDGIGNVAHRVPAEVLEDRGRRAARRAVGRDARHQAVVGRPRAAPRARRGDRVPHPREPAVPQPHRALRAEPRLHRDGAAVRDPRERRVRPDRHRHAADPERDRLPRRAGAHGRVLRRPAAALAHAAVPRRRQARRAHDQRREPALLPNGRPRARAASSSRTSPSSSSTSSRCTTGSSSARKSVERLLHDRRTTFAVVTTLEARAAARSRALLRASCATASFHLGALVLNKTLPDYLLDPDGARGRGDARATSRRRSPTRSPRLAIPRSPTRRAPRGCCARSASRSANFSVVAHARGRAARRAGRGVPGQSWSACPSFDADISDVDGLARIGDVLFAGARRSGRRSPVRSRRDHVLRAGPHRRPRSGASRCVHLERLVGVVAGRSPTSGSPTCCCSRRSRARKAAASSCSPRSGRPPGRPSTRRTSSAPSSTRSSGRSSPRALAHGRDRRGRRARCSARRSACACSASRCGTRAG